MSLKKSVYHISDISELKHIINQWTDVYRIEIITQVNKHKISRGLTQVNATIKEYNYYIADEIKTAGELLNADDKNCLPQINDKDKNAPALITGTTPSMLTGYGLRKSTLSPASEFWSEPIVHWYKLNPDTDIVLNRNLKQIYPYNTGKTPKVIERALCANQYTKVKIRRKNALGEIEILYSQDKQR